MDLVWVRGARGQVPPNAIVGGNESDGRLLYVSRAFYQGSDIPGKTATHLPGCNIAVQGKEITIEEDFEILTGSNNYVWTELAQPSKLLTISPIVGGFEAEGREIFIAKGKHKGFWIPGKYYSKQNVCRIPFGGEEVLTEEFQVLCFKRE